MKRRIVVLALLCLAAGDKGGIQAIKTVGLWEVKDDTATSTTAENSFLMMDFEGKDVTITGRIGVRKLFQASEKQIAAIFFRWNLDEQEGGYHVTFDFKQNTVGIFAHTPNRILCSQQIKLARQAKFVLEVQGATVRLLVGRALLAAKLEDKDADQSRIGLATNGASVDFRIDELTAEPRGRARHSPKAK